MTAVPAPHTFATGAATSTEMNSFVRDPLLFLLKPPKAILRQTVAQSLTNATWASITMDVEDADEDYNGASTQHSTSVNTSRFTAVYAGWYLCMGQGGFAPGAVGQRGARWSVNGTPFNAAAAFLNATAAGGALIPAPTQLIFLSVGDYVELQLIQSNGGALLTQVTANNQSTASMLWVSN